MKIPIYQVDAFTGRLFGGNSTAVCLLKEWLSDDLLMNIAIENNLAETAFFVPSKDGFHLRWFTPQIEMDLCGHATLASAHVLFEHLGFDKEEIRFQSMSGELIVKKVGDRLQLDFPSRNPEPADVPAVILDSLSIQPKETLKSRDYLLVYDDEEDVRSLIVDEAKIAQINIDPGGVICSAKGKSVDFVSRFFTPGGSDLEDPVTGSAHCTLIPFWSERLGKKEMLAHQVSERLGELHCKDSGDRVLISGNAVTYLIGEINV